MDWKILPVFVMSIMLLAEPATAENYVISRFPDEPVKFEDGSLKINEKSSLVRESIVINAPNSPIQIRNSSLRLLYYNSSFRYRVDTMVSTTASISAVSVRHINYDVFGQHVVNLANIELEDWEPGEHKTSGIWNAYGDSASNVLTTVTYISRVRFSDGTQWTFNESALLDALGSLKLEKLIGESKKEH